MGFAISKPSKKKHPQEKILRLRYIPTDGSAEIYYDARSWGRMNDEHLQLDCNGEPVIKLEDHGNGVHIEGDGISIDLHYGQMADLYHALRAHQDANKYRGNPGIWSDGDLLVTKYKRKPSSKKRKK